MENKTYSLNQIMTIVEAAEVYGFNYASLRNKFKPSVVSQDKLDAWIAAGLIRRSGTTWLITSEFMEEVLKANKQ